MFGGGFFGLAGGGEMNEAVAQVDLGAAEDAGLLGLVPERSGQILYKTVIGRIRLIGWDTNDYRSVQACIAPCAKQP